jgi:MFS transporter, VNT family, synaptic vesicle glycoprotein 2
MSEDSEEACLVRSPTVQQGTIIGGSGVANTMPYGTQGQSTLGGQNMGRGSQSHESESGELIDYSDEVLLSQFHADAIKQVRVDFYKMGFFLIV